MNAPVLNLSSSMQMYLVKIKRLQSGQDPVPLSVLADSFNISPVSVNEMCRKLDEMGLVEYRPYKGAALTTDGDRYARKILRRHRLWEVFLVNELGLNYEQAHQLADQLEHATTSELADRLDEYLGFPKQNPDGKPIPGGSAPSTRQKELALSDIPAGSHAIYSISGTEVSAADYLRANGIGNGALVTILARSDQLILVSIGQHRFHFSTQTASEIHVFADPVGQKHQQGKGILIDKESKMDRVDTKKRTLKDLKVGEHGIVVRVAGSGSVKQRMMDMGLVPGSEVCVVRVAPLGDPIEITLKGYNLSLRKSEARDILIEN